MWSEQSGDQLHNVVTHRVAVRKSFANGKGVEYVVRSRIDSRNVPSRLTVRSSALSFGNRKGTNDRA
jgi:hypothetical protein